MPRLVWAPLLAKRKIIRAILEDNPDYIVWHGTHLSAVYLPQLRSIGKPLIWDIDRDLNGLEIFRNISFREMFYRHHRFLWQNMLTAFLPRQLIKTVANSEFVTRIIVPSEPLRSSLTTVGIDPSKIIVVPSAVDINDFRGDEEPSSLRPNSTSHTEDFLITYFGSPCTLRGVDTAIYSMQKILAKRQDVKLKIFSRRNLACSTTEDACLQEEEKVLLELIKKLGLTEHVEVISGMVDRSVLTQCLISSSAIVLPFKLILSEPPLSILEAMSLGKILVTTRLGSLPEVIGDDRGILIEPGDYKALAQVILFIAAHRRESERIGKNAQNYVARLPTWEQIAHQFNDLLNDISLSK